MQLTLTEQEYLHCLADGMTFEEMAVELGWTYHQAVGFGECFFGRDFEERKKQNSLLAQLKQECKHYCLLLMRACKTRAIRRDRRQYLLRGIRTHDPRQIS